MIDWFERELNKMLIKLDKTKHTVVLDVKTTGHEAGSDEAVEISIINGDFQVFFNSLIKPERHTSRVEAQEKEDIERILNTADLIVGYNIDLDLNILRGLGLFIYRNETYDVMKAFSQIYGEKKIDSDEYKLQNLSTCANYYGYKFNTHDSLENVRATLFAYNKINNIDPLRTLLMCRDNIIFENDIELLDKYDFYRSTNIIKNFRTDFEPLIKPYDSCIIINREGLNKFLNGRIDEFSEEQQAEIFKNVRPYIENGLSNTNKLYFDMIYRNTELEYPKIRALSMIFNTIAEAGSYDYEADKMEERGLTMEEVKLYTNPEFSWQKMEQIRSNIENKIEIEEEEEEL